MPIAAPCVDHMDRACVEVCPVGAIAAEVGVDRKLYIDPDNCIDCGACEAACPNSANLRVDRLPTPWADFAWTDLAWYRDIGAARTVVDEPYRGVPGGDARQIWTDDEAESPGAGLSLRSATSAQRDAGGSRRPHAGPGALPRDPGLMGPWPSWRVNTPLSRSLTRPHPAALLDRLAPGGARPRLPHLLVSDGSLTPRLFELGVGSRVHVGPARGLFRLDADDQRDASSSAREAASPPSCPCSPSFALSVAPPRTKSRVTYHGTRVRAELAGAAEIEEQDAAWLAYRPTKSLGPTIFVDNAILVLLKRMAEISRLIGLATLLIAIPLLGIAWMLASNLSSLLILNERRKLGLMRLRGVPGKLLGQSLARHHRRRWFHRRDHRSDVGNGRYRSTSTKAAVLSWATLSRVQGPLMMLLFLVVGLILVLLISRKLVRYATTISPLEASRRVAVSESSHARTRFGVLEWLALIVGAYKIVSWVVSFSASDYLAGEEDSEWWTWLVQAVTTFDRALDFVALPLFVYGLVALLVAQRALVSWLAQLGDLFCRRQTAQLVPHAYVAEAAPDLEFLAHRRLDGEREFVSEHRVEVFRRQSAARRHGASRQRTARHRSTSTIW